ncbi:MAG TPA: glycosyl hydrolase [Limnochordales bacterium]
MRPAARRLSAVVLLVAWAVSGLAASGAGADGVPETAPTVVAVVDVGQPAGRVPPLAVGGFNFANFMQVVGYEREFGSVGVRSIRFPAGNLGDQRDRTPADLDVLLRHWMLLGRPRIVMQARLLGGTPEQAAEAARYARRIGLPIDYWEIGNEPDLYPPAGSWTPEGYCEAFRAFVDALRPEVGDARFAGPAVSGGDSKMEWVRRFIRACGDVVDVVTWHVYPTDGTWPEDEALATASRVSDEIRQVRAWLEDAEANPLGWHRAHEVGLGVTEYGLSWRTQSFRHLADFTAGLWTADVAGRLIAGRVELASYFALQNTGGHGLLDTAGFTRPTFHVFRLLRDFDGQVVPVALRGAPEWLTAYGVAGDDGVVRVLVVNRDPSREASLRFETREGMPLVVQSAHQLTEQSFEHLDDVTTPDSLEPLSVPPRSVTRVELRP